MRNDCFQSRERGNVAYYHLPGLFEFYELYRLFLPLFYTHREYFDDWCEIGSIYGAPADCLWGGGRVGCRRSCAGRSACTDAESMGFLPV